MDNRVGAIVTPTIVQVAAGSTIVAGQHMLAIDAEAQNAYGFGKLNAVVYPHDFVGLGSAE